MQTALTRGDATSSHKLSIGLGVKMMYIFLFSSGVMTSCLLFSEMLLTSWRLL